ncbi:MAG: sugar transferase [Sedimentisphaerales bacterium]|jgi:lipopolysaccharide/colanic/teichoic acid biosynthesis glycosyltransferase|nr:sugar transferase [Sedimentisphaerales bacterium]
MKRAFDILLSSAALVVLSPLLVPVAIILRCTGEGHVFYRQERVGKDGRSFGLYKFATMLKDSPNMAGGLLTKKDDPRILPFGRFLRATKINEIPQLLNVLLGDMSLIGPRPQARPHFDVFPQHVRRAIAEVRPGLSGIGSIMFRDEESILAKCGGDEHGFYVQDIAPYKGELEIWYTQHQSCALDLLLILLTVWIVLFPKSRLHLGLLKHLPKPNSTVLAEYMELGQAEEEEMPDLPVFEQKAV